LKLGKHRFFIKDIPIVEGENLLSMPLLSQLGISTTINSSGLTLFYKDEVLYFTSRHKKTGLYYFPSPSTKDLNTSIPSSILWHFRLGHPSQQVASLMDSTLKLKCSSHTQCVACVQGKLSRKNISSKNISRRGRASIPFLRVNCDTIGPVNIPSNTFTYALLLTDEFSSYRWVFGFNDKKVCADNLMQTLQRIINTTQYKLVYFRSDNGTEIIPKRVQHFLRCLGVVIEPSLSHTPEQNGLAERTNRSVQDMARSILMGARLPVQFWFYAVEYAVILLNRTICVRTGCVPYDMFYCKPSTRDFLKVLGCPVECRIPLPPASRKKFAERTMPGIFIGVSFQPLAYKIYIPEWKTIKLARTVVFDEVKTIQQCCERSCNAKLE